MRIGLLETGAAPPALIPRFGGFGAMFQALLGPGFETVRYDVTAGELPDPANGPAAYLITGASAGVYDDLPWIDPLKAFLRATPPAVPLVGICFGHQLMAEAFGGRVVKSDRGWGIGLHDYAVTERAWWMDEGPSFAIAASHQDQVVSQPPGSRVLAGSAFTPFGLLGYDDRRATSFQGHPEFEPAFAAALIELERSSLPDPQQALESFERPNDSARVAEWIRGFLKGT